MAHLHSNGTRVVGLTFNDFPRATAYVQREADGTISGHLLWDGANLGLEILPGEAGNLRTQVRTIGEMMCTRVEDGKRFGGLPQEVHSEETASSSNQSQSTTSSVPNLQSLPGSTRTIYLDFDGETVEGTSWNLQYNDGAPITAAPYSNPAAAESIWLSIAEDYRVFDVNVTTDRSVFEATNSRNRCMVIFTSSREWYGNAGGVAYTRSFGSSVNYMSWTFNAGTNAAAESASHEAAHQLGLNHDGTATSSYYSGHDHPGSGIRWAPIMGLSYGKSISQFSQGEYQHASESQDDLKIISSKLPYRGDDHGNDRASASTPPSLSEGRVDIGGIITSAADTDWFQFPVIHSGGLSLNVVPDSPYTNLDVKVTLTGEAGDVIAQSAPESSFSATIQTGPLAKGRYYLSVSGSSLGSPADGYPSYGSIGSYRISGTCPPAGPASTPSGFSATDGTLTTHVLLSWSSDSMATGYRVYRGNSSPINGYSRIAEVATPDFADYEAAPDTTYRYYVTSLNALGESGPTPIDTGFRQEVPEVAMNLVASDLRYSSHTRIEWKSAARATGYRVYRNLRPSFEGATEIGAVSGTTFDDAGGYARETYFYFVRSYNAAGMAGAGTYDTGSRKAALSTPGSVVVSNGTFEGGVSVAFAPIAGSSRYTIFRGLSNDAREAVAVGSTSDLEFYDRSALRGETYTYFVQARGDSGDSALSGGAIGSVAGARSGDDTFEPNDRMDEAFSLSNQEGQWIGTQADAARALDDDWFEVRPRPEASRLDVILSDSSGAQVRIDLHDADGELLATGLPVGSARVISFPITVPEQPYLLHISSDGGLGTHYNLLWRSVKPGEAANRSDLLVGSRLDSRVGQFIFEPAARHQKVQTTISKRQTVKSFATAVNEGTDAATLTAAGPSSNHWVRFTHLSHLAGIVHNVSAAMRLSGIEQDLPPLDSITIEIRTRPSRKAMTRRRLVMGTFTTSVTGTTGVDRGVFVYPFRQRP